MRCPGFRQDVETTRIIHCHCVPGLVRGLAFAAALVTCMLALVSRSLGWFGPLATVPTALTRWGGYPVLAGVDLLLVTAAIAVVLRAQSDMGTNWRVGETDR